MAPTRGARVGAHDTETPKATSLSVCATSKSIAPDSLLPFSKRVNTDIVAAGCIVEKNRL